MRNKCTKIFLLLLLASLLPASLSARKHKDVKAGDTSLLTIDQQAYFDSLYFLAVTLEQRGMADSALTTMGAAASYYDSLVTSQGYLIRPKFPTDPDLSFPKGIKAPTPRQVPGLAAAYFFMSNQNRRQNNALQCILNIERAVAIDSVNYWYSEAEGSLFLALKRVDDARVCYERLVRNYPDKVEPLYNMSEIYLNLDSVDLCLQTLNRLEELDGISPQLTAYKFSILQDNGRVEEGFDEYRKLIARYPYNVQYRVQLGDLQMQNGQIPQAKKTYDEASAIEPDNAYVWVAEANYYSMTGDQEAADKLVAQALTNANLDVENKVEVMEEYLKGSFRKLSLYREQVSQGSAVTAFDTLSLFHNVDSIFNEVATMHPTEAAVYELQAQWRSAMGQDSLASECMRFAVDLKPTSQDYWERLLIYGTRWMHKARLIALTDEALVQHPGSQVAYSVAAWAYVQEDDPRSAIGIYRRAIDHMSPPDASQISSLWGNMGDLYHSLNEQDKAYECYETAVKYNPNNYNVLNNYAYYLSLEQKELTKAEQMALKVIQKYPDNPTYLDTYAWILYLEGSYSLAAFYQQHAIDCLTPGSTDNCTLFDHYGDMLVKQHDLMGAAEQWRKALECTDCEEPETIQKKIESAELLSK